MPGLDANTALLIIDLQLAIDHPSWGARNHPGAEANVGRLLAAWRDRGMPLWHVRHDSTEPGSTYRAGQPLHAFKPEAQPLAREPVIAKTTGSAFAGTDLEAALRGRAIQNLVIAGVITNNSVETTVRHGACLGFSVWLAEDACFTFGRDDWNGTPRSADEVHAMTLANLDGEYCTVTRTADILAALPRASSRMR